MSVFLFLPVNSVGAQYTQVPTYADLPPPATVPDQVYVVLATTGVWPFRFSQGFWYSNGSAWVYLSDFTPSYIEALYESNADVNRFSDAYKAKVDATSAGEILVPMACAAGTLVGDIVIPDPSTDNTVLSLANNTYSGLVFGIIHDKPTATSCNVQTSGSYSGASGLTRGQPVFVSATGTPTTTAPALNSIQVIGTAFSSTRFVVDIAQSKVVQ